MSNEAKESKVVGMENEDDVKEVYEKASNDDGSINVVDEKKVTKEKVVKILKLTGLVGFGVLLGYFGVKIFTPSDVSKSDITDCASDVIDLVDNSTK